MPEEVRRSSVQSRRASLAAGRRKSMNTNEPDWEVEAPPTPPHEDYTPRDGAVVAGVAAGSAAAGTAGAAGAAGATSAAGAAAAAASNDHSPMEGEAAVGAAGVADERAAVASVKSKDTTDMSDDEDALVGAVEGNEEAAGRGRTRHIVRFHGEKWPKVLQKQRSEIEAAFLEDIKDGAGVEAEDAKRLKIKMHESMEVTFVVYSESRAHQKKIHAALQRYSFPKTCRIYTAFEAKA
jgi:hypothetical protein